jgi:hypothetical protein
MRRDKVEPRNPAHQIAPGTKLPVPDEASVSRFGWREKIDDVARRLVGVRRDKAALSSGCKPPSGNRSS